MKVKVAVFGREETLERIKRITKKDNDIEILPFTYTHSREVPELIERAFMCDIYLFTGALSYLLAQDKINKKRLPTVHVAFNEYMILTSFYRLRYDHDQQLDRLSLDVPDINYIEKVEEELKFKDKQIYTYSFGNESPNIDKIALYHKRLWDEGKIDYVLTSSKEVESILQAFHIPVSCMVIPNINLESAIKEAKSLTELNHNKSPLVVTGFIQMKESNEQAKNYNVTVDKMKQILTSFVKRTDAMLSHTNDNQFVVVGTKKLLDYIQNHYRDFPILKDFESEIGMPIDIGFGLGLTVKESESHALFALEKCRRENSSLCFIVNERKDTIGPIGIQREIDTSRLFHSLIHKARLNNELSYNFIDFITDRNNEPFSSNDIALYYKVTKRSAERTVNKLLSGNVIKVSGEERPYLKGRPRKLFTLNQ